MQIPAKYYNRIPKFYFIVGILLLINSIYMGMDNIAAVFYFVFGIISVLYAMSVHMVRAKNADKSPPENHPQSESDVRDLS